MNQLDTFAWTARSQSSKPQRKAKEEKTLLFFVPSNPANMLRLSQPGIVTTTLRQQDQWRGFLFPTAPSTTLYTVHDVPLFDPSILSACMEMS